MRLSLYACILGLLCAACSGFQARHYTRGLYLEQLASGHRQQGQSQKRSLSPGMCQVAGSSQIKPALTEPVLLKRSASLMDREWHVSRVVKSKPQSKGRHTTFGKKPLLRGKRVAGMTSRIKPATAGGGDLNAVIWEAALYILAILLAFAIVALAIWLLPSVVIPAAISSAFWTAITIAGIIVLVILYGLVYMLFRKLINLFRGRETDLEDL